MNPEETDFAQFQLERWKEDHREPVFHKAIIALIRSENPDFGKVLDKMFASEQNQNTARKVADDYFSGFEEVVAKLGETC